MIDASKTVDLIKLRFYIDYLYQTQNIDHPYLNYNDEMIQYVIEKFVDDLNLSEESNIIDIGCGNGKFLELMNEKKHKNTIGITLSDIELNYCKSKNLNVFKSDFNFLDSSIFNDESFDFAFCRHALSFSPYPILTLLEINRILKKNSKLYLEVAAPETDFNREFLSSQYSILGKNQIVALLNKSGFVVEKMDEMEFDVKTTDKNTENELLIHEKYYIFIVKKFTSLDIK